MTEFQVIAAILLAVGVPLLLLGFWRLRERQRRRRAALELKQGNKIYDEWRRSANLPLK